MPPALSKLGLLSKSIFASAFLAAGLFPALGEEDAGLAGGSHSNEILFNSNNSWRFITDLTARASYDDNLFISPNNAKADTSFHLAPSLSAGLGIFRMALEPFSTVPHTLIQAIDVEIPDRNFLFVNYTPEGVVYTKYTKENAFDQGARIAGQRLSDLLVLTGIVRYENLYDASIDTGSRVHQIAYIGDFKGTYVLTGKTSLGARLLASHYDFPDAYSYSDGRVSLYGQYRLTGRTQVNVGGMVGRLLVDQGSNQTFVRPWVQMKYLASQKITLSVELADDIRSFANLPQRSTAVFGTSLNYRLDESLEITASASRDIQVSAFYAGENILSTYYQLGFRERVYQRNFISPSAGFTYDHYQANTRGAALSRNDNYQFYKVAFARDVTTRGTAEISYEFRKNHSSIYSYGFSQNVVNASISYRF